MSQKVREEMLPRLRQRYVGRGRQGRTRMIDELCEQFGYSRKHAIKLLNARTGWGGDPFVRKGRPPAHGVEVVEVLWRIWKVSEQPCGKRLVAMLELWLPHYEAEHGRLPAKVRKQLPAISAAQADRLLAPRKAQCKHRGRSGTKPGSLLKHHICFVPPPGAHRFAADFGWLSRSDRRTRRCPYYKNDNGHVEQKNWTHVRQLPGYERLADPEIMKEVNTLYRELWEPLHNYFCASAMLVSKDRHGAKVKRRHDRPLTPWDQLLASNAVSAWKKAQLKAARQALNSFELNRRLEAALRPLLLRALHSSRPTGSLHCLPAAATLNA